VPGTPDAEPGQDTGSEAGPELAGTRS
jgi:hypothetical protein